MDNLRTCVAHDGHFSYGIHSPKFNIANLRKKDFVVTIGVLPDKTEVLNKRNFPDNDVKEEKADIIYEIPNPFFFRGTT